jgi:thiopurine S-methyltransferase
MSPAAVAAHEFLRHSSPPYEILEGDSLALMPDVLGSVQAVYDRAALVALPPETRAAYAESLARLLPSGTRMLLIAMEYPQEMKGGPPFSVEAAEIQRLFEPAFDVDEVERHDVLQDSPKFAELGIPALFETVFVMGRK